MKKIKVYVKYELPHDEWGEHYDGHIYSVETMDSLLKFDIPHNLPSAKAYIYGRLKYYRDLLARQEKERVEMKIALKKLGPYRNPIFEEQYKRIRRFCKNTAKEIKKYKKISYSNWEMVQRYMYNELSIEYQEHEIEVPD